MVRLFACVAAAALGLWTTAVVAGPPQNLGFEQMTPDGAGGAGGAAAKNAGVPGWFVPPVCEQARWVATVDERGAAEGERCGELRRKKVGGDGAGANGGGGGGGGFGNLMQAFDAEPYRGKRIVVTAKVRVSGAAAGRAQLWLRVDRANGQTGLFDNCADRPVTEQAWTTVTIAGNVEDDAASIALGLMVFAGNGPAWIDDVKISAGEKLAIRAEPPRELTERGLANLVALTRALGYVRHYSPSDEAAQVDWGRLAVDATIATEGAENAEQLAAALRRVFGPIAPAAKFQAAAFADAFDPTSMLGADDKPTATVVWKHRGFGGTLAPGGAKHGSIYFSERVTTAIGAKPEDGLPAIGDQVTRSCALPGGEAIWMRVPIVLYKDEQGTLPRAVSSYAPSANAPELSGGDRATRLAGVMLAWNVLEHFFPYFDVVKDDWDAAMVEALRSAATDADGAAYLLTLQRLTAHLHDGHGYVGTRTPNGRMSLPVALTFVGDEVVVESVADSAPGEGVRAGDVVNSIGGKPIAELVAFAKQHEPAATDGFFHVRAARWLVQRENADPVDVEVKSPDGAEKHATMRPVTPDRAPSGRSGPVVSEPSPGVWYVDLDRATDQILAAVMPKLAEAKGVVFDMRGYPSGFSMGMLGHLSATPIQCAKWEIPLAEWPDSQKLAWDHSRWSLPAIPPRIMGKVAFITDGRAISAAETFLGMVEAYKLAEIVGEPTAGTNGNVNVIELPAGYTISFTGMKVLKNDGSRHHGIGIQPTVPAHRTIAGIAAGKDELREAAIGAVSADASAKPGP